MLSDLIIEKSIGLILAGSTTFFSIILSVTYIKYKTKKTKQDILIIERLLAIILFNVSFIFCSILSLFDLGEMSPLIKQLIFTIILVYYYSNIFCCYLEQYKRISNPFYFFFAIFNNKKKTIYWELCSIGAIGVGLTLFLLSAIPLPYDKLYPEKENTSFIFITINIGVISLLFLFAFASLFLIILSMIQLSWFLNPSRKSLKRQYFINLLRLILMLLFAFGNFSFWIYIKFYKENTLEYYSVLVSFSYSFLTLLLLDIIFEMVSISISDFFFYVHGKKKFGCFYSCFGLLKHFTPPTIINKEVSEPKKEHVMYSFQKQLNFDLSQFTLEAAEYFINTSLSSISLIYDSLQSNKVIEYEPEKDEIDSNINTLLLQTRDNVHYREYHFNKKSFTEKKNNTLTNVASNILDKSNATYRNNVHIEIKSFYPKEIKRIIDTHVVDTSLIKASLLSHASKFPFLIYKNSMELSFQFQKTFSIKTADKKLNIEIFEDVLKDQGRNAEVEDYLNYLIKNKQTFLPVIIGIFKIKINDSSPFIIFISKNTIVENVPSDQYNYWQLMRFSDNRQIDTIASSKDSGSVCVTEELFKGKKIQIENFNAFCQTFKNDINLLSELNSKHFAILVMYYEFDGNRKSSSFEPRLSNDNQTGKISRVTDFKHILYQNDISSIENNSIFDLTKTKKEGNGYDAGVNGRKCMLFFTIEGVFEFRGVSMKTVDYNHFNEEFISYYEAQFEDVCKSTID